MNGRRIELFLIVATGEVRRDLRRFQMRTEDAACPRGYHDASNFYDRVPATYSDDTRQTIKGYVDSSEVPAHDDTRWPLQCDAPGCTYSFVETDEWQVFIEQLYRRPDTGEEFTLRHAPIGAVWECPWYIQKGPDGKCVAIQTPGGMWLPDLSSKSGTPWQRTGTLPKITCNPSILIHATASEPEYHGWLRDGVLIDC